MNQDQRRFHERVMMEEAVAHYHAPPRGSIDRKLGDELIDAGQALVRAWTAYKASASSQARDGLRHAIARIERLVGSGE